MLGALAEAACRTSALVVVLQCALWLLRARQARLLLMGWTLVLMASIAMPALPRFAPLQLPVGTALPAPLVDEAADLVQEPSPPTPVADTVAGPQVHPSSASWFAPASWLPALYLTVACGMALRVLVGLVLSLRLVARAVRIRPDWAAGSHVRVSRDVTGPVTIANVILVPIDALAWSGGTRQAVLAHERAHVARWDFALLIASRLNRALYWFNPLSWWLHHRLVGLAELASDDQAIALTRDPIGYAEVLLQMGRRPGRVFRDLAMARPSTLPRRIDRILSGGATSCRVGRSRQLLLMTGVAGLSLGIAGLVSERGPVPAAALFAPRSSRWDQDRTNPTSGDAGAAGPGMVIPHEPSRDGASPPASPPVTGEAGTGPRPASVSGLPTSSNTTATQPPHGAAPSSTPRAPSTSRKTTTAPRPSRVRRQADPVTAGVEKSEPTPRMPGVEETWKQGTAPSNVAGHQDPIREEDRPPPFQEIAPGSPSPPRPSPGDAGDSGVAARRSPTPEQHTLPPPYGLAHVFPSVPLSPEVKAAADDTCTGTIAVGWGASREPNRQPSVTPGQMVPARARFFHRPDGTFWVRFDAFDRPALDLPVRFTRNGMTWTGEYGIAYTVRAAGRSRLAGLASQIARDSAVVSLSCRTPADGAS